MYKRNVRLLVVTTYISIPILYVKSGKFVNGTYNEFIYKFGVVIGT